MAPRKLIVTRRVEKHFDFLYSLIIANKKERLELLEKATKDQMSTLAKVASNVFKGKFELKTREEARLAQLDKEFKFLEALSRTRTRLGAWKIIRHEEEKYKRRGGMIPAMLKAVLKPVSKYRGKEIMKIFAEAAEDSDDDPDENSEEDLDEDPDEHMDEDLEDSDGEMDCKRRILYSPKKTVQLYS